MNNRLHYGIIGTSVFVNLTILLFFPCIRSPIVIVDSIFGGSEENFLGTPASRQQEAELIQK